ncbi:hypothetical protein G647_01579 [Cladophialophora carrionii CBS 160.54]|uniref:Uncharacterized protein n=1 Tax=Cladophialophora carrionii CBS 160.54 TaxID=1279043 RepID=V9DR32_9EURO|nr:uncharacterized protein G647_01579 [Cladophialophora carrionii CBS 160.54]ETI29126.1 hypothetical protein G647_01579 [Cladophialophora carrionii CBS 160.54]
MSSEAVDDQLIKRIKDEIEVITGDELPRDFIRYGPSFTRQSLKRLVHGTMLAEFGRDYLIQNDALEVLLLFAQFHVACIMRGTYLWRAQTLKSELSYSVCSDDTWRKRQLLTATFPRIAANLAARMARRRTVEGEDFALATKLLEEKEHQMMLKRAYERWVRKDRMGGLRYSLRTRGWYGW